MVATLGTLHIRSHLVTLSLAYRIINHAESNSPHVAYSIEFHSFVPKPGTFYEIDMQQIAGATRGRKSEPGASRTAQSVRFRLHKTFSNFNYLRAAPLLSVCALRHFFVKCP